MSKKTKGHTKKTVILGAGLTGLTRGYLLNQKGTKFEILEKEHECGGLMRSLNQGGFTFDFGGSHIIFSKDAEVLDFMLDLLGNNKVKNRRNTKILYNGVYVKYPFENGLADLPKQDNFECLSHFVQNLVMKERGELTKPVNLKEWFYYVFGKGIAEKYLIPYNNKIWKYPLEKIALDWVERIPNPPLNDIIKSSLGLNIEGYLHQLTFYYPKVGGIQALINALVQRVKNNIITNFEVKRIKLEDKKWIVSNGTEERICDKIISTIPIHHLIAALDAPKKVETAVKQLKYNSLITVMLGFDEINVNEISWLYIPDKKVIAHRISFPSTYSPSVTPEGKHSILAEITCNIGDHAWMMNDEELIDAVINDLTDLKIITGKECFAAVRRNKFGYVINDLRCNENMRIISDWTNELGIDLVGRFSEFKYLNMDGCIRNAMNHSMTK